MDNQIPLKFYLLYLIYVVIFAAEYAIIFKLKIFKFTFLDNITFLKVSLKRQGFQNIIVLEFAFQCQNTKGTYQI